MRALCLAAAAIALPCIARAQTATWSVDLARPALTIGADANDTAAMFTQVVGATRLPNGSILVGDHAAFSLHLFGPNGARLRTFGRNGDGPGEFGYLAAFFRCGDSVVTHDISGRRTSVFALDGRFVRMFRFGAPPDAGSTPYISNTACNQRLRFVHHGWETPADRKVGPFRPQVVVWTSGADSGLGPVLGRFAGVDRIGTTRPGTNRLTGTSPRPLGRQLFIANGADRIYIGTAERFEILVFGADGKRVRSVTKAGASVQRVSAADIDAALAKDIASAKPGDSAYIRSRYAAFPLPDTLPAYNDLVVDADDNLWVQDYPRMRSPTVRWTVFAKDGRQLTEVVLPRDLEVFEIGRDYVLGRYLDADEGIPHVRMYALKR
jgi:hypothetical protein